MWAPALYDSWASLDGTISFESFAMVTDEPPKEVLAAGHDRCPIFLVNPAHCLFVGDTLLADYEGPTQLLVCAIGKPVYAEIFTFTEDTLISATDFSYDDNDIVIDGVTVTIDWAHEFLSLKIINGGDSIWVNVDTLVSPLANGEIRANGGNGHAGGGGGSHLQLATTLRRIFTIKPIPSCVLQTARD